jgi:hypothetical protein
MIFEMYVRGIFATIFPNLFPLPILPIVIWKSAFYEYDVGDELVLKPADQLRLSQSMAVHGVFEIPLSSSRGKRSGLIQGVESEGVPMNRPMRRA